MTFPDGDGFVGLSDEEDFAVFFNFGFGVEQEDGILLGDAGEVEQIAVLFEREGCVGVARIDRVRVDHGDGIGFEERGKVFAVADKER